MQGGSLPPQAEKQFQQSMYEEPGWRDWRRDYMRTFREQPNLSPGGNYNYRLAWSLGARPEMDPASGTFHGLSSALMSPRAEPVPIKAPDHQTMWKEHFMRRFNANPDLLPQDQWTPEMAAMAYEATKNGRR